uniref:Uncharacterized protein n=1 Tax=Aegilops tauschii subsp. strangulata TaxID=200361 RepID=A0A453KN68_AEGTS
RRVQTRHIRARLSRSVLCFAVTRLVAVDTHMPQPRRRRQTGVPGGACGGLSSFHGNLGSFNLTPRPGNHSISPIIMNRLCFTFFWTK